MMIQYDDGLVKQIEAAIAKSCDQFVGLQAYVRTMAEQGADAHTVEQGVWDGVLALGRALLGEYFVRQGTGDVGEALPLTEGRVVPQCGLHTRQYVSVFGPIAVTRMCYGESKIEAVPMDAHLNLPERAYSYLLQQWSQAFAVHDAYGETVVKLEDLLHVGTTVRTLEHVNRDTAQRVAGFRETAPPPDPAGGETIVVAAVDGKGVPICRDTPPEAAGRHRRTKGDKANKKKMACVGAVYTIRPFRRTVDEVLDEVRRRRLQQRRPMPQQKHVQANLLGGKEATFTWMAHEVAARNPEGAQPVVCLGDGERALWTATAQYLPGVIEILDLFHVTEKLWLAAHCFHKEGSAQADAFVEERLRRLLEGKVAGVIGGLRQMATKQHVTGTPKKTLEQVTGYFERNNARMHYDTYLAHGYPIGSGVAEGACRHLVKDRMERTGMRWTLHGAQAMLDLRATYLNGEWDAFWDDHITHQHDCLYGHIAPTTLDHVSKAA